MFRSPKDHLQGVGQALLKLPLYTINMYAYVVTLARLDVLPEDGPMGDRNMSEFYGILAF